MSSVVADQASGLRALMEARWAEAESPPASARAASHRGPARVIAVASGKGGVGKTNIAVNLAIRLAAVGRRVILLDADLGTANADVILNVHAPHDLSDVLRGELRLADVLLPVEPRLRMVVGASGLARAADLPSAERARLVAAVAGLEAACDVLLLDCGAGISRNVLAFAQACDDLLIVTTPDPAAVTDAYALMKVAGQSGDVPAMDVVVNRVRHADQARAVADRLASVAARFLGRPVGYAGHVVRDEHVERAVARRVPFVRAYPGCPASRCISALAGRLAGGAAAAPVRGGFFRRLAAAFN